MSCDTSLPTDSKVKGLPSLIPAGINPAAGEELLKARGIKLVPTHLHLPAGKVPASSRGCKPSSPPPLGLTFPSWFLALRKVAAPSSLSPPRRLCPACPQGSEHFVPVLRAFEARRMRLQPRAGAQSRGHGQGLHMVFRTITVVASAQWELGERILVGD